MDKELVGISLVILSVVSGVTFAGHQLPSQASPQDHRAVDIKLGKNLTPAPRLTMETLSSQIINQYEKRQKEDSHKREVAIAPERKFERPTPHYLLRYKIRL